VSEGQPDQAGGPEEEWCQNLGWHACVQDMVVHTSGPCFQVLQQFLKWTLNGLQLSEVFSVPVVAVLFPKFQSAA
jgi:hypothetical protein